jgi:hypothetical protein
MTRQIYQQKLFDPQHGRPIFMQRVQLELSALACGYFQLRLLRRSLHALHSTQNISLRCDVQELPGMSRM